MITPENCRRFIFGSLLSAGIICVAGQTSIHASDARFWLSTSPYGSEGPESPEISIGSSVEKDVIGRLYIWGRPREQSPGVYGTLASFSLNLISSVVPNSPNAMIDFLDDQIDVFNEELPHRRFEFERDSTATCFGEPLSACIPAMTSEVSEQPDGTLVGSDKLLNIAGYTLSPGNGFSGIGGSQCDEANLCVNTNGEPAWLIASIGYKALASGEMDLHLQIGSLGMNHAGEASVQTTVRFGNDNTSWNAKTQRETNNQEPFHARIRSSPAGDFDESGQVGDGDLTEWRNKYSSGIELPGSDGSGIVDGGDFLIWQQHRNLAGSTTKAAVLVPEPSIFRLLLMLTGFAWLRLRLQTNSEQTSNSSVLRSVFAVFLVGTIPTGFADAQSEVEWIGPEYPSNLPPCAACNWADGENWSTGSVPDADLMESALIANGYFMDPFPIPGYQVPATITSLVNDVLNLSITNGRVEIKGGGSISVRDTLLVRADLDLLEQGSIQITEPTSTAYTQTFVQMGGTTSLFGAGTLDASTALLNDGILFAGNDGRFIADSIIQSGGLTILSAGIVESRSTIQLLGGTVSGNGTLVGTVDNVGARIMPGQSPGILTIDGDYTQSSEGILTMELGGTDPGSGAADAEYDQLIVMGDASLDGLLEIQLYDLGMGIYEPSSGHIFDLVTATGTIDPIFEAISLRQALPEDVALLQDVFFDEVLNQQVLQLQFVEFNDELDLTELHAMHSGTGSWFSPSVWSSTTVPNSTNAVMLHNMSGGHVAIEVDTGNAFAHRIETVSGDDETQTTTLSIGNNRFLSAIQGTTIGAYGILKLDGGTLVTSQLTIGTDGRLEGNGRIVGEVANSGTISPGTPASLIEIDGDLVLNSSGRLIIDIEGNPPVADRIDVAGTATLGGTLELNISSDAVLQAGDTFTILGASSISANTFFDDFEVTGSPVDGTVFAIELSPPALCSGDCKVTVNATTYDVGDLDLDGNLGDPDDFKLLGVALADFPAFDRYIFDLCSGDQPLCLADDPSKLANVDGLGGIDIDDAMAYAENLGIPFSIAIDLMYGRQIPEPASACLVLFSAASLSMRRYRSPEFSPLREA